LTSDDIEVVNVTPKIFQDALAIYRTHQDKSWGMTDCTSFVVMWQSGLSDALTHDQHFSQAGFDPLLRSWS
jgi:predicted nucleic acid-binding protein